MAENDNDLKDYLETDNNNNQPETSKKESTLESSSIGDTKSSAGTAPNSSPKGLKRLHFWSDWPKKKKIYLFAGTGLGLLLISSLSLFFIIRPSKTNSYIESSWHGVVSSSSSIDRAVKSEVNLEGTRDLTKELYSYNEKLGSTSFEAKSKSSITYSSSTTKQYGELTKQMGDYFSDSATILAKTDTDISTISDSDLSDLQSKGSKLKSEVDAFRTKRGLDEQLNPNLFALDVYITDVKSKKETLEKEKLDEEQKKKDEVAAAAAKDAADKSSVESLGNSYYKALINGSEAGVKATLSKGYQGEYDFAALTPARRINLYPKSYRVVSVTKDGDNYKLSASVTYISVYQDGGGNNVESPYTSNEFHRVVYSSETGSWKLDGRVDS